MTTPLLTDTPINLTPDTGRLNFQDIDNVKLIISANSNLAISKPI